MSTHHRCDYAEQCRQQLATLGTIRRTREPSRRERNAYQRDYTRVLYSSSFRRLQGKMQLLGVQNDQFFRNRLTHSLEAAQIAREIAEILGYTRDEIYVVEACALAHDLGNPPFGHYGEKILHAICQHEAIGGFEGNAQTMRILTRLEKKNPDTPGLNLTLRTLLGVAKYLQPYTPKASKFLYNDDYQQLLSEVQDHHLTVRTIDVQIMDLADEIAYAAHDLEDSLGMKLFTIDELVHEFTTHATYKEAVPILEECVAQAREFAQQAATSEEYRALFKKELTATIVHTLVQDLDVVAVDERTREKTGTTQTHELGLGRYQALSAGLKTITFACINREDDIQLYEKHGEKVIRGLYEVLADTTFNQGQKLLPVEFRATTDCVVDRKRSVIDYIAGMMDTYAVSQYARFFGPQTVADMRSLLQTQQQRTI